jgi:hypothetical protein
MGGSINSTFLALIPKLSNPFNFTHFHSVSLCNAYYNILSKIIKNRLKHFLSKLIYENQGSFMAQRQIVDSIILVREAVRSSGNQKEK